MNLQELEIKKEIKKVTSHIWLKETLLNRGFKILGWGAEAIVARHPTKPYALKLFFSNSKYIKFVDFCKSHSNNPHVPKFSRYVATVPGTNFSYVRMELLTEVDRDATLEKHLSEFVYIKIECIKRGLTLCYLPNLQNKLNEKFKYDLYNYDRKNTELTNDLWKTIGKPSEQWTQIVNDLLDQTKNGINLDLHEGNFMLRDDDTLVITDPWV